MAARICRVIITGRVQGVGFRAWTGKQAMALGLSGYVRNLPNGKVEVLLSGESLIIDKMLDLCRLGPRLASVTNIDVTEISDVPPSNGFNIL
jgi:acylphosphatase